MKGYSLFYQPHTIGDVLLILFEAEAFPTRVISHGETHLIYDDERLIGVNLFNVMSLAKIHAHGLINNVPPILVNIINDKLANAGIDVYLPPYHSGFRVARVIDNQAMPKIIVNVGEYDKKATDLSLHLALGQLVVIALDGTLLPNGRVYHSQEDEVMICSRQLFDPHLEDEPLQVGDSFKVGSDYFQWE